MRRRQRERGRYLSHVHARQGVAVAPNGHTTYSRDMRQRFLTTPSEIAGAVRDGRREAHLTQAQLAAKAGVGRRFIVDLETGHERAELGKVLAVLETLNVCIIALAPASGRPVKPRDVDGLWVNGHVRRNGKAVQGHYRKPAQTG